MPYFQKKKRIEKSNKEIRNVCFKGRERKLYSVMDMYKRIYFITRKRIRWLVFVSRSRE